MDDSAMKVSSIAAPVRQQVATSFRAAILTGRFRPGERLIEKDLCELTGASRTSVREALRQLETEGLVEMVPNRGPIVAAISLDQARSIYEIRGVLEGLAGSLFAARATDAQIARLNAAADKVEEAYGAGGIERILLTKDRFYGILLEGSGNDMIAALLRMMHARISLLRRVSLGQSARLPSSIKEIRAILKAVKSRNPAAAAEACRRHVEKAAEAALDLMRRAPSDRKDTAE